MKMIFIDDVYGNAYSTKQKFVEVAERLEIGLGMVENRGTITEDDYLRILMYRLSTAKDATLREKLTAAVSDRFKRFEGIEKELEELKAQPKVERWYHKWVDIATDFINTLSEFATSPAIIFLTLVSALILQVNHLAHLVVRVSDNDSFFHALMFGIVAELTALLLTIHSKKKKVLMAFAFLQAFINILYYTNLPSIIIKLTLSGLIAFVIFSYSDIYANTRLQSKN